MSHVSLYVHILCKEIFSGSQHTTEYCAEAATEKYSKAPLQFRKEYSNLETLAEEIVKIQQKPYEEHEETEYIVEFVQLHQMVSGDFAGSLKSQAVKGKIEAGELESRVVMYRELDSKETVELGRLLAKEVSAYVDERKKYEIKELETELDEEASKLTITATLGSGEKSSLEVEIPEGHWGSAEVGRYKHEVRVKTGIRAGWAVVKGPEYRMDFKTGEVRKK